MAGSAPRRPVPRLATSTPYDCWGSFVSLHLRAGASPLEVAQWAGHSPAVMFKHYANVIEELVGEPRLPAEEQIKRARLACQQWSTAKLEKMVVDLFENSTLSSPGSDKASIIFYKPGYERLGEDFFPQKGMKLG